MGWTAKKAAMFMERLVREAFFEKNSKKTYNLPKIYVNLPYLLFLFLKKYVTLIQRNSIIYLIIIY
jgi:hypothetical protein